MKKVLLAILLTMGFLAEAQVYNNEWIDYSKTYYKFKVGKDGLYRIPQSVISAAGLSTSAAEQFQLWRNGMQVPVYTSVATGAMGASDYIEFWGLMNDGKPDKTLYRNSTFHFNERFSLLTDTAAYYLTLNPNIAENLRLETQVNDVAGNTLPAEPYLNYTLGQYYKNKINNGFAVNVGENLYSSSYDRGEGWTSSDISTTHNGTDFNYGKNTLTFNNLFVYSGGVEAMIKIGVSGNTLNQRKYRIRINGDSVAGKSLDFFNISLDTVSFPLSVLSSNTAVVEVSNLTMCNGNICPASDRMVIHYYEINYPRLFNFGGASNFEFKLSESATGNYLEISNFNYGTTPPVLMDLTNMKRYVADMGAAPLLRFALPASAEPRKFVLVSQQAANINTINSLQQRNFIDYSLPSNQGNYLIISNSVLFQGPNGSNPVEEYRAYRNSAAGGSHNAKIYLENELEEQFGFGIKKHPVAIRNFLKFARMNYNTSPKFVFLMGKGVHYVHQRTYHAGTPTDQQNLAALNLVPTFGWPGSDILLAADQGSSIPQIPIGRLSVISPAEVTVYLDKIKAYELAQKISSPNTADKEWMKNVIHIVGASESGLSNILDQAMSNFKNIISDTLFGANVSTFSKSSSEVVQQLNNSHLTNLINDGTSLITYFGHSSSSTLEFNLDDPENYNNAGKYPMFIALGCNAGNFFNYAPLRFVNKETISEKYVLSPNRGTIGFIASSHFGIVHYLDIWNTRAYKNISALAYGKPIGEILKKTIEDVYVLTTQEDFYARSNAEQTQLHGDPALTMNTHEKPDYVIESPMVRTSPNFISVADPTFKLEARLENIGKAPDNPVVVEIKREYPNQTTAVIFRDTIPGIRYVDSVIYNIPIDPLNDKGLNKITVTIDPDNEISELFESNNSVTKEVMIFEDEARPIYPYNFAIINQPSPKLFASTANPFAVSKTYRMELDTTELFNSPLKIVRTVTTVGGVLEFDPGLNAMENVVYYWRISPDAGNGIFNWNTSSFIYLANSDVGFNQSHYYQQFKSTGDQVFFDSATGQWKFGNLINNLFVRNGVFPTAASFAVDFSVAINADPYIRSVCGISNIIVNVVDPVTFKPWLNAQIGSPSQYGSDPICGEGRIYNFQYNILDSAKRRKLIEFIDLIPDNYLVIVRNTSGTDPNSNTYPNTWKNDTTYFGSGKSIYHRLYNAGFTEVDSFNRPRAFIFVYQKNNPSFAPKYTFSQGIYDKITLSADYHSLDTLGNISSPVFGPAKEWKQFKWTGTTDPTPGDKATVQIIGIKNDGTKTVVVDGIETTQATVDISSISAAQYPFLQLRMRNADSIHLTPYQLTYWRLTYVPSPEGAVSPNIYFSKKDTLDVAEPLEFKLAFRNITGLSFDSLKVRMIVTDKNNIQYELPVTRHRPLAGNDTIHIRHNIDTRKLVGNNLLFVEVNPDFDQPEQYHFNNTLYTDFYVRPDTLNPLLDVTFDNVRILNHDIVSAKPNIRIQLRDEAKWFMLSDTATMSVQVRYPDNTLKNFYFDGTTMEFIPAQQTGSLNNTASVNLKPVFDQDGEYELIVSGKDMSQNQAGTMQYRVSFQVINKPMISNMLNYPNPFTTSTAFVFTLTGSEVPQNLRIQILTVTGKVVRDITKEELGPIHIGRNITEYKWDGTDQFGQKLANGIYLYRVITNLNGHGLDKYKGPDDNTDKYFNKGYGKMVLIR